MAHMYTYLCITIRDFVTFFARFVVRSIVGSTTIGDQVPNS